MLNTVDPHSSILSHCLHMNQQTHDRTLLALFCPRFPRRRCATVLSGYFFLSSRLRGSRDEEIR